MAGRLRHPPFGVGGVGGRGKKFLVLCKAGQTTGSDTPLD